MINPDIARFEFGAEISTIEQFADVYIEAALAEIERKYGPHGETPLSYHHRGHTLAVVEAATTIAKAMLVSAEAPITPHDLQVIRIAAVSHDLVHDGSGDDEEQSLGILLSVMQREDRFFDDRDRLNAEHMILATKTTLENDGLKQSASKDNVLTQIMADADLASLGRPPEQYWQSAYSLLLEHNEGMEPTEEQLRRFLELQIPILEKHKFYTEEAARLFPHQQENIVFVKAHIAALEH
ncbi:MAG TPA: HD domain-containing protein [Chroococcales cyanobacterium]